MEIGREAAYDDGIGKLRTRDHILLGQGINADNAAGLAHLRAHRRRHQIGFLEAGTTRAKVRHERLNLPTQGDLGAGQLVGPGSITGKSRRIDDRLAALRIDLDVHLAALEWQRVAGISVFQNLAETPKMDRSGRPQPIEGAIPSLELARVALDVVQNTRHVDIAEFE